MKRALPFGIFITFSLMIIVTIFYAMNQNHTQLNVIKERLKGGRGLGPESYNMMKLEKEFIIRNHQEQHRPVSTFSTKWTTLIVKKPASFCFQMVQFYPDNQNKLLFRKNEGLEALPAPDNSSLLDVGRERQEDLKNAIKLKVISPNLLEQKDLTLISNKPNVSYKVHAFYYGWYGNPAEDGQYIHVSFFSRYHSVVVSQFFPQILEFYVKLFLKFCLNYLKRMANFRGTE